MLHLRLSLLIRFFDSYSLCWRLNVILLIQILSTPKELTDCAKISFWLIFYSFIIQAVIDIVMRHSVPVSFGITQQDVDITSVEICMLIKLQYILMKTMFSRLLAFSSVRLVYLLYSVLLYRHSLFSLSMSDTCLLRKCILLFMYNFIKV